MWLWNVTKFLWSNKKTGLLSRKNWIFFIKSSFSGKNTFLKDLTLSNENSVKELPWIPINEGLNTKYLSPFFSWRCSSYSFSHFLTRDTRWGTFNVLEYIVIWILLLTWDDGFPVSCHVSHSTCKVHIFWEGHKILRNLPLTFDRMHCSRVGD